MVYSSMGSLARSHKEKKHDGSVFFVWIEIKRPTIDQPWQRAMCPSIPKMSNVFKREMSANERKRDREGDREQDISRSSQGFFAKKK